MYSKSPKPQLLFSALSINNNVKTGNSKYSKTAFNIYLTFEN